MRSFILSDCLDKLPYVAFAQLWTGNVDADCCIFPILQFAAW